jgi:hypothetical protein
LHRILADNDGGEPYVVPRDLPKPSLPQDPHPAGRGARGTCNVSILLDALPRPAVSRGIGAGSTDRSLLAPPAPRDRQSDVEAQSLVRRRAFPYSSRSWQRWLIRVAAARP